VYSRATNLQEGTQTVGRRNITALTIIVIASLCCMAASSGCVTVPNSRAGLPQCARVIALRVPEDYLVASRYCVNLLSPDEAAAYLRQRLPFRAHESYTLHHFCKEVSRATGKRIVWLPESGSLLACSDIATQWSGLMLPPPGHAAPAIGADPQLQHMRVDSVLSYLAQQVSVVDPDMDGTADLLWTVWLGQEAIFLVKMPDGEHLRAGRSPRQVRKGANVCGKYQLVTVVLPKDDCGKVCTDPDVPTAGRKSSVYECNTSVEPRKYSLSELSNLLEDSTGARVSWMPMVRGNPMWNRQWVSLDNALAAKPAAPGSLAAGTVVDTIIADATEMGVERLSPDREIWCALEAGDTLLFLMLPAPWRF